MCSKCLLPPSDANYRPKAAKPESSSKMDSSTGVVEVKRAGGEASKLAVEIKRKDKQVSN